MTNTFDAQADTGDPQADTSNNDPAATARLNSGPVLTTSRGVPIDQDPRFTIPLYLALGIFCGLILGLLGFNAATSIGPTTTETATLDAIDITTNATNGPVRTSYWVSGETESGGTWRFASEAAYDLALQDGYPMEVTVRLSNLTGTAVGLQVQDIDEKTDDTINGILFTAGTVLALMVTALTAWVLRKVGVAAVVSFVIGAIPIGSSLGFIVMHAWRAG